MTALAGPDRLASMFDAICSARRALEALVETAWRAFDEERPLAECQDPVEDVLAALERALRELGATS